VRTFAARKPGFDVGRFLAGLGHRRIAYFSPSNRAWPLMRFEGIKEALTLAGPAYSAAAFIQNQMVSEPEINEEIRRRHYKTLSLLGSGSGISPDYSAGLNRIMDRVWIAQEGNLYFSLLLPLFEQALSQKEITAWVGCDDDAAMMAWSFLTSRNKLDYRKIALMGFGNTYEAVKADMTSYDFNFEHTAGSILTFLLRPLFAGHMRKLAHPEIDGFVIERGSTAAQRYYRMKAT
jgi:DNA-binding LacI/PurR family transcriptional regulator